MTEAYRSWHYGPKGEAQLFTNKADVPSGWKDTPPAAAKDDVEAARRSLDIPPGRHDRAALPVAVAGIVDQITAEISARISPPPTADERPTLSVPTDEERYGERQPPLAIPDPVRDQGDKQPHYEAHNWHPTDKAKMLERERLDVEGRLAAREAARAADSGLVAQVEAAFDPTPATEPTMAEVEAETVELTPEQVKAAAAIEKADPIPKPAPAKAPGKTKK